MVSIHGFQLVDETRSLASFDIVHSGLRALRVLADSREIDPATALRAGVAEKRYEAVFGSELSGSFAVTVPTSAWTALSSGAALQVVTTQQRLAGLSLDPGVDLRAGEDLQRTSLIAESQGEAPSWWRIDTVTGAVTGIDQSGRGGAAVFIILVDSALFHYFTINAAQECGGDDGCQTLALIWNTITLLGGASLGVLAASGIWGYLVKDSDTLPRAERAVQLARADIATASVSVLFFLTMSIWGANPLSEL